MVPINQWTDNDWTAIGTVIGAIGTVGAFAAGLYLLGVQVLDRRRGQARLVAAWPAGWPDKSTPGSYAFVVRAENVSTEPVYGVFIRLVYGTSGTFVRDIGVLGPAEAAEIDIVVPGLRPIDPTPDITFTDAAGRAWTRYGKSGKLVAGNPNPPFEQDAGAYPSLDKHTIGTPIDGRNARRVKSR